jgi:UDP-N-acetylmuramyl pentapeptide synthase
MPSDHVHIVERNAEAITLLEGMVEGGDVILVKGSRAMEMEEIVNALGRNQWTLR